MHITVKKHLYIPIETCLQYNKIKMYYTNGSLAKLLLIFTIALSISYQSESATHENENVNQIMTRNKWMGNRQKSCNDDMDCMPLVDRM